MLSSAWLTCPYPKPAAKMRLFCFAYAGGGASVFREWGKLFPDKIEVWAAQLPGRETRLREPAMTRLAPVVNAIAEAMLAACDRPFALFGHSMGGLISFEVTRFLRRSYSISPVHLFVSGVRAPHLTDPNPPLHPLTQTKFLHELKQFNGTPSIVLENAELMAIVLPTLRADFELLETYCYQDESPLPCPITAFGGIADPRVSLEQLSAWKIHTKCQFSLHQFPGDHFFITSARSLLLQKIAQKI